MGPPGPAASAVPARFSSLLWNAFVPGSLERTLTLGRFTPDGPITVTRIEAQLQAAGMRCRRDPVLTLSDGTANGTIALPLRAADSDSGAVSVDIPAGSTLVLRLDEARDCRAHPAGANISVQYKTR